MLRYAMLAWLWIVSTALAGQNVVVLLDDSGSMNEALRSNRRLPKIEAAKNALRTVMEQLPPEAHVGVLVLNGADREDGWIVQLGPVDKAAVQQTIQSISAGGSTPLGDFMKRAADQLLSARETQLFGTYRLLIVTDGEATDKPLLDRYLPEIIARGITLDVIGVDMERDHSLANRVQSYRRADDPGSLTQAIEEALAESVSDPNDPDQDSAFDLLAALPDEVAIAAVEQLCRVNNQLIGTHPVPDPPPPAQVAVIPIPPQSIVPAHAPAPAPERIGRKLRFSSLTILLLFVVMLGILMSRIMASNSRRR